MTARQYLYEIKELRKDQKLLKAILDNCHIAYNSIKGMDYSGVKVQTSPKNALEEAAWQMLEDQESATRQLQSVSKELNERLSMIRKMHDPVHAEVLYLAFYECKDADDIAKCIGKKSGTVANIKGDAIKEFQHMYFDNKKGA